MNNNKSSIPIPLFLMGSLIIMLVVTPSLNIFSNAIAQGYGDRSSYSTYPTENKKYECRTGPFEGFLVSSVEFCKHINFDDRKDHSRDNRTGTQGPPGPAGAQGPSGPTGAQGATGITFLNGTNLYRVVANQTVADENDFFLTSFAECDSGDSPVNGLSLYAPTLQFRGNGTLALSGTVSNETGIEDFSVLPTGYITTAFDVSENDVVQSFVTCFDNPPAHIP